MLNAHNTIRVNSNHTCGIGELGNKPEASAELQISSLDTGSLSTASNILPLMSVTANVHRRKENNCSRQYMIPKFVTYACILYLSLSLKQLPHPQRLRNAPCSLTIMRCPEARAPIGWPWPRHDFCAASKSEDRAIRYKDLRV